VIDLLFFSTQQTSTHSTWSYTSQAPTQRGACALQLVQYVALRLSYVRTGPREKGSCDTPPERRTAPRTSMIDIISSVDRTVTRVSRRLHTCHTVTPFSYGRSAGRSTCTRAVASYRNFEDTGYKK
jgi:hypothetical protein